MSHTYQNTINNHETQQLNPNTCLQVTTIKTVKQMDELVNLGDGAAWHEKWRTKLTSLFHQVTVWFLFHRFLFGIFINGSDGTEKRGRSGLIISRCLQSCMLVYNTSVFQN